VLNAVSAFGFAVAAAWCVGRLATDSIPALQSLHWIPTIASLATMVVTCACCAIARRRRSLAVGGAIVVAQLAVLLIKDWHPWRERPSHDGCGSECIRLAHFNANWPGRESLPIAHALAGALRAAFGSVGADLVVISERGDLLAAAERGGLLPQGVESVAIGRFAVISRLKLLTASPLFDNGEIAGVIVEFKAEASDLAVRLLAIDAPSDLRIERREVMGSLGDWIDKTVEGELDIVVGDFNVPRGAGSLRRAIGGMTEAFDAVGSGWGGSFPRTFPLWHIDQLWCGNRARPRSYALINLGRGEHLMQAAVVEISTAP